MGTLVLIAGTAAASETPNAQRSIKASAADLLALAEAFQRGGEPRRAEPILELLAHDSSPEVRNEARFRLAMLMESAGRLNGAAVLLRQIVDDRPDVPAVRIRLATLLQKLGDEDTALRHLRALRAADLPPSIARFVDRLSASLQATKPLGLNIELALAPDSNINRATRSDSLGTVFGDFALDQKSQSGVGAAVRAVAHARQHFSSNLAIVARAAIDSNLYRKKEFDDISLDLSAGPEWRVGRTRVTAEAGLGQQWFGMKPYQRNVRVAGSATQAIGAVAQARIDLSARWIDNSVNQLQDGRGLSARLRVERALSPLSYVSLFGGVDRFKARDDAYSTRSWSAGVTVYRELGRMTLMAGAEVGRLEADDRLAILPQSRSDRFTRFQVGGVFRNLTVAGFAPLTRLTVERNRSSVAFYDYRRTRTEVGISRAF